MDPISNWGWEQGSQKVAASAQVACYSPGVIFLAIRCTMQSGPSDAYTKERILIYLGG